MCTSDYTQWTVEQDKNERRLLFFVEKRFNVRGGSIAEYRIQTNLSIDTIYSIAPTKWLRDVKPQEVAKPYKSASHSRPAPYSIMTTITPFRTEL